MKIALVQVKNTSEILVNVTKAIEDNVDLICFPEMSLCGYGFEQIPQREAEQHALLNILVELSIRHDIIISVGGIERSDNNNFFITQYVINKTIEGYRKTHLGSKEKLYFKQGNDIPVFECKGISFGIMTCYDSHFPELTSIMALKGAQFVLNPTAVPHNPEKRLKLWSKYLPARAYDNRVWVMANNLCSENSGGGIIVYNADGDLCYSYNGSGSYILTFNLELKEYNKTSMKNRDFKADRREDLYGSN